MGVIENAKEIAEVVEKFGDIELNRRILNLEIEVATLQRDKLRLEAEAEEMRSVLRQRKAMQFKQPYYYQEGDS